MSFLKFVGHPYPVLPVVHGRVTDLRGLQDPWVKVWENFFWSLVLLEINFGLPKYQGYPGQSGEERSFLHARPLTLKCGHEVVCGRYSHSSRLGDPHTKGP